MPQAARKGDLTVHGGVIAEGSPDVTIGGMPAARLLDKHVCPLHGPGPITETSFTVFINKVGAARVMDKCTCMIPSKSLPGANNAADKQKGVEIKASGETGKEKKYGENEKEWDSNDAKDAKDGKEKPAKPEEGKDGKWKPKVAVGGKKELWSSDNIPKGPDGKPKDNFAQALTYETKGTAEAKAEFESIRDMKATAGAKAEVEGSVYRAQGKLGDAKEYGEVSGEAKFLTAKADAGAGGTFQVENGRVTNAYAEASAGAGASVVEGKVAGKKTFTIPFVGLDVTVGGEGTGSLLTAEARASAYAGIKDGKFKMGAGAKLGALIAGLGFKFNIEIGPTEKKEEPPKAPGVPGVVGIDPIAIGCMTVLIGGVPPPYIPGAPKPDQPPAVIVDAIGIRNKSQALTLKAAKRAAAPFTPVKCDW